MNIKTTLTLVGFLMGATPALADEPIRPDRSRDSRQYERPDDHRDRRDHRDHDRDRRDYRDDRGRLSNAERQRIADYQAYVSRLEREAWYDGYVSRAERTRIYRARQTLERMIQSERYDGNRR